MRRVLILLAALVVPLAACGGPQQLSARELCPKIYAPSSHMREYVEMLTTVQNAPGDDWSDWDQPLAKKYRAKLLTLKAVAPPQLKPSLTTMAKESKLLIDMNDGIDTPGDQVYFGPYGDAAAKVATKCEPYTDVVQADSNAAPEVTPEQAAAAAEERQKQIESAAFPSAHDFALVVKDPDSHVGELFNIWGQVTQFDAATGTESFLASTASRNMMSYGYFDGENAWVQGDANDLKDLVEDDVFTATVQVVGSFSYDTQAGGNTTVPQFQVLKVTRQ